MAIAYTRALEFTESDGTLTCSANSMTIDLNKTKFDSHKRAFRFYFDGLDAAIDPACSVDSEDGASISSDYNKCGIMLKVEDGKVSYSQTVKVTYGKTPDSLVQREETITFDVVCSVDSEVEAKTNLNVTSIKDQTISKSAETDFDIKLFRTTDGTFTNEDSSSQLRLGDQMYFKLVLNTPRNDLKISPTDCYAKNTEDSDLKYYLIQNGCPNKADGTVKVTDSGEQTVYEWENEAFRFFGDNDAVFVTCEVNVCQSENAATECNRCDDKTRRRRAISTTKIHHFKTYTRIFNFH